MKVVDPLADTPKTYSSESDVADLISDLVAEGEPLEILVAGESYTLELASRGPGKPTPETVQRSIAAIKATAGGWKDFDAEAFLEYIYRRRSAPSTRPPVRL